MNLMDIQYIYENCGDYRATTGARSSKGHFVDPFLKLYHNIPLMFVSNEDVPNGHANGTRVLLKQVILTPGSVPELISIEGHKCLSINADSIHCIICSLDNNPLKLFHVRPKTFTCHITAPIPNTFGAPTDATIKLKIVMTQLPVLVNNATTGHKLQGQTKTNLVISVWSKKRNWNYVALSRVTTRKGLFLVSPLPHDVDFSIHGDLKKMLHNLEVHTPHPIDTTFSDYALGT